MTDASVSGELFDRQLRLQSKAASVLADLRLLDLLKVAGEPRLVGSLATGLMVWRDIDITVACARLNVSVVMTIASRLLEHPRIRSVQIRNDTGERNQEPSTYPDGLFLGIDYRSDEPWELDIWFVDEPERQPDLRHADWMRAHLTDETRAVILDLKHRLHGKPGYSSHRIYEAVMEHGVRSIADYEAEDSALPSVSPPGVVD